MADKLYKNKGFLAFYDEQGENILYMFDNVRQILAFQNKPITKNNVNLLNVELYRALRSDTHNIKFLTGEKMKVYVIDVEEEET